MSDFRHWPDLAARSLGASVVATADETFAPADNLINPGPSEHDPLAFGPRGKIYDGWETRRRRDEDRHETPDWAIVRLGAPGIVRGVVIDTAHFTGNYPPYASVEGTTLLGYPSPAEVLSADWVPLLARSELEGDAANAFPIFAHEHLISHVRLSIYPDGGVARFRVHGEVVADPRFLGGRIDLGATVNGGRITGCSNMFYSAPANLLAPGRARVMSDGWETSRRRDDGHDWVTVALAAAGVLHDVIIDTGRFVGNAPGQARLTDNATGDELLPLTRLQADTEHRFRVRDHAAVSEVRLDILPDGGLSRLRLLGTVDESVRHEAGQRWLGLLPVKAAAGVDESQLFD
ncbi:allantoicase [Jatrophihabitans telluris]|uniref:Probable allantoicase n=1 Tax=Jatrophihabitans telluris TaxID=2038343 RepID=A0ABY4QXX5_9ACTN|nr:allantoicase [Jatrophihabitans telluris]UQX88198.1 allantoicase [Jatrophihabitans telluris]